MDIHLNHIKPVKILGLLSLGLGLLSLGWFALQSPSQAADIRNFDAGNLMSDSVMSDKSSMSVQQIQTFLESKNSCNNTNTYLANQYPSLQYNIKDGKFVCMARESFNGESAAQLIWQTAQDFTINPRVLIVLLEKEQGLVSDTWPNSRQYQTATGFGCPDTAPCDAQYFGLKNQLRLAASLFRKVLDGGWSNYPIGNTYVQYHPNAQCGGSIVNIQNRATSALYRYTPYQPNQSALNAGYGTGDSCGAYGNRNFWRLFSDWFGSPNGSLHIDGITVEGESFSDSPVTVKFSVRNVTPYDINLGRIGVGIRGPSGENLDQAISKTDIVVGGGDTYTYRSTIQLNGNEGSYRFYIIRNNGGTWHEPPFTQWRTDGNGIVNRKMIKQPVISSPLALSTSLGHKGESVDATFTVKNPNATNDIKTPRLMIGVRGPNGENYDMPLTNEITIKPGSTFVYAGRINLPKNGKYTFFTSSYMPASRSWNDSLPILEKNVSPRKLTLDSVDSVTLTSPLTVSFGSGNSPVNMSATFKLKNYSSTVSDVGVLTVAARDSKGKNRDLPLTPYLILQPGEEYTYSQPGQFDSSEIYNLWIANYRNAVGWNETHPISESSLLLRSARIR